MILYGRDATSSQPLKHGKEVDALQKIIVHEIHQKIRVMNLVNQVVRNGLVVVYHCPVSQPERKGLVLPHHERLRVDDCGLNYFSTWKDAPCDSRSASCRTVARGF